LAIFDNRKQKKYA